MADKRNTDDLEMKQAPAEDDGKPQFGRLLVVLGLAVILIIVITFVTEAYYSS